MGLWLYPPLLVKSLGRPFLSLFFCFSIFLVYFFLFFRDDFVEFNCGPENRDAHQFTSPPHILSRANKFQLDRRRTELEVFFFFHFFTFLPLFLKFLYYRSSAMMEEKEGLCTNSLVMWRLLLFQMSIVHLFLLLWRVI